ncbi:hypothetical protein ACOME3_000316 [Neoechinorhynchus agilis]
MHLIQFAVAFLLHAVISDDPNRKITKCEVCKFLAVELGESFEEYNSSERMRLSYSVDEDVQRSVDYRTSETRLVEVLENVCKRMLQYNVHAERLGSNRYAKGRSQTMSALWGLRNRGVNVVMDVPNDLWDHPSAEISELEKQCNLMLETVEDRIENWYKEHQAVPIVKYLCEDYVLLNDNSSCLNETFVPEEKDNNTEEVETNAELNLGKIKDTSTEIKDEDTTEDETVENKQDNGQPGVVNHEEEDNHEEFIPNETYDRKQEPPIEFVSSKISDDSNDLFDDADEDLDFADDDEDDDELPIHGEL